MKDGDTVRIIKHVTLHGMSLKGRTGRITDVGEVYATVEISTVEWLVRIPKRALAIVGTEPVGGGEP